MKINKLALILTTVGTLGLGLSSIGYAADITEASQIPGDTINTRNHLTFTGSDLTFTIASGHDSSSLNSSALGTVTVTANHPGKVHIFSDNAGELRGTGYDAAQPSTALKYKVIATPMTVYTGDSGGTTIISPTDFNTATAITDNTLAGTNQVLFDIIPGNVAHNSPSTLTFSFAEGESLDHHTADDYSDSITVHFISNT